MSSADVRSLAALETFQEQCRVTRAGLLKELDNLQIEIRRLSNWIEIDADRYWGSELQQAERYWAECHEALLRCESYVRASEQKPCTEQRKRVEKAAARRAFCQQQVRIVREAKLVWQQEYTKMLSKIFRCRDLAESDLTAAIAQLSNRLDLLDSYTQLRSGAVSRSVGQDFDSETLSSSDISDATPPGTSPPSTENAP